MPIGAPRCTDWKTLPADAGGTWVESLKDLLAKVWVMRGMDLESCHGLLKGPGPCPILSYDPVNVCWAWQLS